MGAREFEAVLARLYVDAPFRKRFLASPEQALAGLGLSDGEKAGLARIDRAGLILAAGSYARKRAERSRPGVSRSADSEPAGSLRPFRILAEALRALTRRPRR